MSSQDFSALLKQEAEEASKSEDFTAAVGPLRRIVQDKVPSKSAPLDRATAKVRQQAAQKLPQKEAESASSGFVQMVGPNEELEFRRPGVQPYVLRKLRQGEYREADFIDLHGLTLEKAYEKVMNFMGFAQDHEFRCVLIVHGKGEYRKQKALIKSYVAHWLKQLPEVLAYRSAPEWKGGTGALMIVLKKGEKASALNRELHARR
ncbi:MAG: Smr/MutS family protein [Succinivibrio sp.]|jgi:DNA-nicking Smr family endonuclease|nr:Smr/MutS family protein [Succinivibrio sp.]